VEETKARGNSTMGGGGGLFGPAKGGVQLKMKYDGGTPKQETNLLPFVPIFLPSGLVNLCASPPQPPTP